MENIGIIMFVWTLFSLLIGLMSSGTKIGFLGGFMLSFILSPVIGLIVALISGPSDEVKRN